MGVYLDGAVDGAREETTSRDGETSDAALVSHQGLGTCHVLHVPHLHTGTNEERTKLPTLQRVTSIGKIVHTTKQLWCIHRSL